MANSLCVLENVWIVINSYLYDKFIVGFTLLMGLFTIEY